MRQDRFFCSAFQQDFHASELRDTINRLKIANNTKVHRQTMETSRFIEPDQAAIERFLSHCRHTHHLAKVPVIRPGDPADSLYYIITGSLVISLEDEAGNEVILAYANAGDFIGEMGLFMETRRRDATVRTRTDCELAEIQYSKLRQLLKGELKEDASELIFALGKQLSERLLHTNRKVGRLAFMDVAGRLARTLLDLCQEPDAREHPDGVQIKVSRKELSRIASCSREMAGRVVKSLEEQGLISVSGMTIVVHEPSTKDLE